MGWRTKLRIFCNGPNALYIQWYHDWLGKGDYDDFPLTFAYFWGLKPPTARDFALAPRTTSSYSSQGANDFDYFVRGIMIVAGRWKPGFQHVPTFMVFQENPQNVDLNWLNPQILSQFSVFSSSSNLQLGLSMVVSPPKRRSAKVSMRAVLLTLGLRMSRRSKTQALVQIWWTQGGMMMGPWENLPAKHSENRFSSWLYWPSTAFTFISFVSSIATIIDRGIES